MLTDQSARAPMGKASAAAFKLSHQSELLLRNGDALRGMGMQAGVIDRWQKRNQAVLDMTMTAVDRGGIISGISKFVRLVAQLAVMGLGAYLVIHQEISGGIMVASSILLGRVLAPVELTIGGWRSFVSARLSYRRLEMLLRRTPAAEDAMKLPAPTGRISVERLTYVPPGAGKATLKGISLTLDPGEILAIIGPTAAGKSTLSRLLDRRVAPDRRQCPPRRRRARELAPLRPGQGFSRLPAAGYPAARRHDPRQHQPRRRRDRRKMSCAPPSWRACMR